MRKIALATFALVALLAGSAFAAVDVQLAFTPETAAAGDEVHFFASIANLGDTEVVADLEISLSFMGYEVGPLMGQLPLAAGEELSQEMVFVVPPLPFEGTLEITVAATCDGVTSTATASLTITGADAGAGFAGLDELGDSVLAEISGTPLAEENPTFGGVKAMFR